MCRNAARLARQDPARRLCPVATRKKRTSAKKSGSNRGTRSKHLHPRARIAGLAVAGIAAAVLGIAIVSHPGTEAVAEGVELRARRAERIATTVPATLELSIVARHPHDRGAFTQGLLWHDGRLFESTGLEGRSTLREVELTTGRVLRHRDLPADLFGEGLARVGDRLFQITWQNGVAYEWDIERFERIAEHRYPGEGWGLCFDGESLVMSDGSDTLTFRDPNTFASHRTVRVTKLGRPARHLNELECVEGSVFANVWQTDEILRIDPESGRVTGVLVASGLLPRNEAREADVLNGIAYVPETGRFLLTGKLWPTLFEVEIVER
ncbi:MAG: glutaminyl-peptide cyclotransferase [Polyangiaceae bacterium]|nr:glutaminyl-peptide cyclotransferase [Polyangiaceae bacterium]